MNKSKQLPAVVPRFVVVDYLRGWAIVLMVFFHLFYYLNLLKLVKIDFFANHFWFVLPRLIVTLFLLCVGVAQAHVNRESVNWKKGYRRFVKIFSFAIVISIGSYIYMPSRWIYFGTLHCIAFTSLAALFFVYRPKLSLWLGIALLFSAFLLPRTIIPIGKWLGVVSTDYIPFYPWFGVVLLGIYCYHRGWHTVNIPSNRLTLWLQLLGRWSLWIYLIHIPLIFSFCYALKKVRDTFLHL